MDYEELVRRRVLFLSLSSVPPLARAVFVLVLRVDDPLVSQGRNWEKKLIFIEIVANVEPQNG